MGPWKDLLALKLNNILFGRHFERGLWHFGFINHTLIIPKTLCRTNAPALIEIPKTLCRTNAPALIESARFSGALDQNLAMRKVQFVAMVVCTM